MKNILFPLVAVLIIGIIKMSLGHFFVYESPFSLFVGAVGICSWYGGYRQGIWAYVFSVSLIFLQLAPEIDQLRSERGFWVYGLSLFSFECFVMMAGSIFLKKTQINNKQTLQELQKVDRSLKESEALFRKVYESKDVDVKLRQSEIFLDSVIENIPNMIFVKDAKERKYLRLNKAGENLWGRKQSEVLGKRDHEIFDLSQASFFEKEDLKMIGLRETTEVNEDLLVVKNETRYLHTKRIPIFDDQGNPQYILGIAEDITEKRKNEIQRIELLKEQIARSEIEKAAERLRILAEATTALGESLDIDSMLQSFSALIVKDFADWFLIDMFDENGVVFQRAMDTYRDPDLKIMANEYKQNLDRVIQVQLNKVIQEGRGRIFLPAKEERGLFTSAITVPMIYCGKVFGTLTFVSTDSNKIFNNFDLSTCEDLGERCSLAVINARLFNKANEASRAKSAFLANMSHEIRTPLGAMLGFAELVMDEANLEGEQKGHLSAIVRNGRHLLRIVDEILDLTKVESERIQIEMRKFCLPQLLDEILMSLKIKAQEKGLDFVVQLSKDIHVQVISDPTRLKQILVNVVGNAIKFTEQGKITVDIQLEPVGDEATRHLLKISVEDTGVGIPPREVDHLFQPFVQADGSMSRKFGGTGLGLFLSRKLARLLNGDVVLKKSRFAKGSLFLVSIEVERMEAELLEDGSPHSVRESGSVISRLGDLQAKILIVDDSEDNQVLVAHYLSNLGLGFDVAENGREGVDKALSENYDVILMDIQMPEMDGFQAMQLLRQSNYRKPIVALTAHAMKGDRDRCLNAGFDDYLSKPLSKETLKNYLFDFFSKQDEARI